MENEKIIQALKCCITDNGKCNCKDCPYDNVLGRCYDILNKDAIDLINRLKAENERLKTNKKNEIIPVSFEQVFLNDSNK